MLHKMERGKHETASPELHSVDLIAILSDRPTDREDSKQSWVGWKFLTRIAKIHTPNAITYRKVLTVESVATTPSPSAPVSDSDPTMALLWRWSIPHGADQCVVAVELKQRRVRSRLARLRLEN